MIHVFIIILYMHACLHSINSVPLKMVSLTNLTYSLLVFKHFLLFSDIQQWEFEQFGGIKRWGVNIQGLNQYFTWNTWYKQSRNEIIYKRSTLVHLPHERSYFSSWARKIITVIGRRCVSNYEGTWSIVYKYCSYERIML